MIVLMLLTAVLLALVVFAAWCAVRDQMSRRQGVHAEDRPERTFPSPASLEGVLVTQLTTGKISRPQYRRAMSQIAAREGERRPMSVPMDD